MRVQPTVVLPTANVTDAPAKVRVDVSNDIPEYSIISGDTCPAHVPVDASRPSTPRTREKHGQVDEYLLPVAPVHGIVLAAGDAHLRLRDELPLALLMPIFRGEALHHFRAKGPFVGPPSPAAVRVRLRTNHLVHNVCRGVPPT